MVTSVALLMFGGSFVKEFQFLRWARQQISALARLSFGRSGLGRSLGLTPFLSLQRACRRKHKGIQHWLSNQGPIACTLMRCHLIVHLYSGVTVLASILFFALKASVCTLFTILLTDSLLRSSQYCCKSKTCPDGLLAQESSPGCCWGRGNEHLYFFTQEECIYAKPKLVLVFVGPEAYHSSFDDD